MKSGRNGGIHPSFSAFVQTPPLEGLGADLKTLERICADDAEAKTLLDSVVQKGPGNPTGANQHTNESGTVDNINDSKTERPNGTSSAAALRRLRKDRPDLHEQVIAGHKSPHVAIVEAGFRTKTITVPLAQWLLFRPRRASFCLTFSASCSYQAASSIWWA